MPSALEQILIYHDATKHHPGRYARSLGYLDWASQPDAFRRFEGAPLCSLPIPGEDDSPTYDDLFRPGAVDPRPVTRDTLSRLFYRALAISAWKQYRDNRWALRCDPSSGNLHPTEGYIILPQVADLHPTPAVYHYAPREHALELRAHFPSPLWAALAEPFPPSSFFVGLTSTWWREIWKYGERGFRYCQHDAGHGLACLRIAAATLGWRLVVLEDLSDDDVAALLGIVDQPGVAIDEQEHPELVAAVCPATADPQTRGVPPHVRSDFHGLHWLGRANRLSPEHVHWDIIDMAADATVKPISPSRSEGEGGVVSLSNGRGEGTRRLRISDAVVSLSNDFGLRIQRPQPQATSERIIRQRRSALDCDGRTSITADTFYHMLLRVMPGSSPAAMPFDAISWSPRIHLLLFVHLVEGLPPGLYALARDPAKVDFVRGCLKPEFDWSTPPGCPHGLPLFFLMRADCRRAAALLSLQQAIAGDSAFSLGMAAELDASLGEFGPWFYRRLYWEAGMVGQVLYLEAEAAGVRSTGIGAYYDDLVHDVFGITDHRLQSLYHFTVGGPVEDKRLTTLPSYPAPD